MLDNFFHMLHSVKDCIVSLWMVSQKYEMRKKKKLDQEVAEIRTFVVSPFEHVVSMNRFCLDMNMRFYRAGAQEKVFSFVGRSKYKGGFNNLYVRWGVLD